MCAKAMNSAREKCYMVLKKDFTYASSNGKSKIHAVQWKPEGEKYCGVLQIIHGMVEYIDRYDDFARFMAEKGFVVVGNDHLGHGATAASKSEYGFFDEKNGNAFLLRDIHKLREMTAKQYPELPYFILGHSMGSFLVRQYLFHYIPGSKPEIGGAIIMGTGNQPIAVLKPGQFLCRLQAAFFGWHHRSKLIDKMAFGGYYKRLRPCRTKHDWLTKDTEIVDAYGANEWCTFRFTVNGYYNLFVSIEDASKKKNLQKMPKNLPVLFVAGAEDPVGNYGKGVEQVYGRFKAAGMKDLKKILYENDRHEILNETDRKTVYQDIYEWISGHMQET